MNDMNEKEWRLNAVQRVRKVQHLLRDQRSVNALDVADRYATGDATRDELSSARIAAWGAAAHIMDNIELQISQSGKVAVESANEWVAEIASARSAAWVVSPNVDAMRVAERIAKFAAEISSGLGFTRFAEQAAKHTEWDPADRLASLYLSAWSAWKSDGETEKAQSNALVKPDADPFESVDGCVAARDGDDRIQDANVTRTFTISHGD